MIEFISDHITTLGVGLILSIGIFCSFKAGQVFERSTMLKHIHEFDLEKLKQKTQHKLEMLFREYCNGNANFEVPQELDFKSIVERAFIIL